MIDMVLSATMAVAIAGGELDYRHFHVRDQDYGRISGRTVDTCIDNAGGITSNLRDCNAAQYDRPNFRLNLEYGRALARLPNQAERTRLRNLQREWLRTRWNSCHREQDKEGGGTLGLLILDGCENEEMVRRIAWVMRYGQTSR